MTLEDMTFEKIVKKTKKILDKNYREKEIPDVTEEELDEITEITETGELTTTVDTSDLEDICAMVIREAAEWTNRYSETELTGVMNDCWPVIVKCACIAYLNRGAEGLGSQSELGQQNVFNDWIALMHKQITNRRHIV